MATDAYLFVELPTPLGWMAVLPPTKPPESWEDSYGDWPLARSYGLFWAISGVRGQPSFTHSPGVPKGLPSDASSYVQWLLDSMDAYEGATWMTASAFVSMVLVHGALADDWLTATLMHPYFADARVIVWFD